jgi:hypothetical protein
MARRHASMPERKIKMNNHESQDWTVLYVRDGTMRRLVIESTERPSLNRVAIAVRDTLASDEFAIPDVVPGSSPDDQASAFFVLNNMPVEKITIVAPGQAEPYMGDR